MGFIWVDTIKPQSLAYSFLNDRPLSMIMAVVCMFSFMLNFKQKQKHTKLNLLGILLGFSIWVTITTVFSLYPDQAWVKWNDSIKVLIFSALIPFFIANKNQLEAIMIAFSVSMSFFVLAVGVKTIFGGGGYGVVLIPGRSGVLAESSTFAAFAVMLIPFHVFLAQHSILFSHIPLKRSMMLGAVALSVLATIGSGARTGLLGIGILFVKMFSESRRKIILILIAAFFGAISLQFMSESWYERMDTLKDVGNESSAMGRVVVWRWTLDFVQERPIGGGFVSYLANRGKLNQYTDNRSLAFQGTKAFHSIYFEVLGEHGYLGLFLYLLMIFLVYRMLGKIKKESDDEWIKSAAVMLRVVIIVFLVCGAFIGIAFQPTLYLMIAYSICLNNLHVKDMSGRNSSDKDNAYASK